MSCSESGRGGAAEGSWDRGQGERIAARIAPLSPVMFLMSGGWILAAMRRLTRTIRHSFA